MNFFRNKKLIGIVCLFAAGYFAWGYVPGLAAKVKETTTVIRVVNNIPKNTEIKKEMLQEVEVSKFKLSTNVIKDSKEIIGKFSRVDLFTGDNLTPEKFLDKKLLEDAFLYKSTDEKRGAVSVTVKSLAAGLSGKLMPGDIVTVKVFIKDKGAGNSGTFKAYPRLQYVEVGAINNNKAQDTYVLKNKEDKDKVATDTIVPATVTLLADEKQAEDLIEAENIGAIHIVFMGRGFDAKALLLFNGKNDPTEQQAATKSQQVQKEQSAKEQHLVEQQQLSNTNASLQKPAKVQKAAGDSDFNIE